MAVKTVHPKYRPLSAVYRDLHRSALTHARQTRYDPKLFEFWMGQAATARLYFSCVRAVEARSV